jgi:hypothetical protein
MESQFRLLPFEELISLLSQHGFTDRLAMVMKMRVFSEEGSRNHPIPALSDECREKYSGTWWEILLPLPQDYTAPLHCFYVADSLRDALRLRPRTDLSFWANSSQTPTQFLNQTQEWFEEMEEAEMLD